jgi:hypothetical protein
MCSPRRATSVGTYARSGAKGSSLRTRVKRIALEIVA